MDEIWLVIISVSMGGAFALIGGFLNHYLSTSVSKKKKELDLIDDFITSCFDYFVDLNHLFESFNDCFEDLNMVTSKDLNKICKKYCKQITDEKCKFDKSWKKFNLNFARTRIVLKDEKIKTNLEEIKVLQTRFDKYLNSTDEPTDLENLHNDKTKLNNTIKEIKDLRKNYVAKVRELHKYIMEMEI